MTRLVAKPNQNEQGSRVVRLRCAAVTFVGCMGPAAVRRRGKGTAISGIVGTGGVTDIATSWEADPGNDRIPTDALPPRDN